MRPTLKSGLFIGRIIMPTPPSVLLTRLLVSLCVCENERVHA